jgi:hypothetical protein
MKRLLLLFVLLFSIISCQDQLEDNSPAIQGHKDGNLWRATSFAADIDAGGFVIEGRNLSERVQLITTNDARGTFDISIDSGNVAVYVDTDGTIYSTKKLKISIILIQKVYMVRFGLMPIRLMVCKELTLTEGCFTERHFWVVWKP